MDMTDVFPPCPAPFNMAAHVLVRAGDQPDKVALAILTPAKAKRYSYAHLETAVRGVATGMLQRATPGDRVLLRLGNTVEFPIAFLGAIAAGLIPVPTSSQLTVPEITAIAHETDPALIIAGDGIALPDHPAPVVMDIAPWHDLPPADYAMGDPNRPGYIIYTSGTSGVPRAVVHAHRAIWARQMMMDGWYGLGESDRVLHAGAFNWTYTLGTGLMDPWTMGATALIPAKGVASMTIPLLLKRYDATIFAAAPGIYRQMLRGPIPPLPKLRHGLSAGEKMAETVRESWRDKVGTDIHEAFGMSECSTFISGNPNQPAPSGTMGFVQPGRNVVLIGPDGPNDHGTIAVHRSDPGLMLEYLNQPAETAARFDGDWFLTGDLGRRMENGAILYDGRADDMMNAGGYRVSPIEVETALITHPDIDDAAAVELQVKSDASVIAAFYTGAVLDDESLNTHAHGRLAHYKCPRMFIHCDSLPRNANNKLNRRALREEWEATHGHA